MKHTQKDMALLRFAEDHHDPAKVPFTFTLDGTRYEGFPAKFCPQVEHERIDANITRYRITAKTEDGLLLTADHYAYRDFAVSEWVMSIQNVSDHASVTISDWRFATTFEAESACLYHGNGDTCGVNGYEWQTDRLTSTPLCIAPVGDGTSCNGAFPYMRLLTPEWGVNLAIGWSGPWSADFAMTEAGARFTAGQGFFNAYLKPGESVRTPRLTMQIFEGGHDRGRNLWRSYYFAHMLPREKDGKPLSPKLFVHTWAIDGKSEFSGTTEQNQKEAIDTYLQKGFEPDGWWIDAGWYPCNYDWGVGVGNLRLNEENYPNGLKPVSDHLHKNGIDLLLWFEPERNYKDTDMWREHPEFLLFYKGDNQFWLTNALFNLADPIACDWLIDKIDSMIKEFGVDIYRQDFNFQPMPFWQQNSEPGREGVLENLHIQGYYRYWDTLLERNPGLWIDSCASGGRRNDPETMRRAVPLHYTDVGYGDHYMKQAQHRQMFEWIPYFRAHNFNWCGDDGIYNGQPHRIDGFAYQNAMVPAMTDMTEYYHDEVQFAQGRTYHAIWRKAAEIMLRADYYPLTECRKDIHDWYALQFDEDGKGLVQVIRNVAVESDTFTANPFVFDKSKTYTFTEAVSGEVRTHTGAELLQNGMTFTMPRKTAQMWFYTTE